MNAPYITLARWLFCLPIVVFGISHVTRADMMAGMIPSYMPGPGNIYSYLIGIFLIAAGVAIALRRKDKLAGILLAALLLVFVLAIHIPSFMGATDDMSKALSMTNILKDIALAGGALTFSGLAK